MIDFLEDFCPIFAFAILCFLLIPLILGLFICCNGIFYKLDKSNCIVTVAGNEVYNGRCHFISINSIGENGNTKQLIIYDDIWRLRPKARYVNQNIEVKND